MNRQSRRKIRWEVVVIWLVVILVMILFVQQFLEAPHVGKAS